MKGLSYKDAGVNMKNGFTLVELSIVLVIIGLLIGGILVGQSLISSARIHSLATQISQYDAAISSFQTRFRSFPGDSDKVNPVGDNNKSLDPEVPSPFTAWLSPFSPTVDLIPAAVYSPSINGERAYFWRDLMLSGLKIEGMPEANIDTSAGMFYGEHIPETASGGAGVFPMAITISGIFGSGQQNIYMLTDNTGGNSSTITFANGALTITEAINLDNKIDDREAHQGDVIGLLIPPGGTPAGGVCQLISLQNYPDNPRICSIMIRMLSQNVQQ